MRQTTPTRRKATRNRLIENLETRRLLATFTVDTVSDVTNPTDGLTTLREAVLEAEASPGADEIVFDPTVFATPQTITLTQGEIVIGGSSDLTITDSAAGVTIGAGVESRHFTVLAASSLTFNGLVLTGGNIAQTPNPAFDPLNPDAAPEFLRGAGGSTFVNAGASLTTVGTTFDDNEAGDGGAIFAQGTLTFTDTDFTNNTGFDPDSATSGGAVAAFGADTILTITGGSFVGNSALITPVAAGTGGAIRAQVDTLNIDGTSFSNNVGDDLGGALFLITDTVNIANADFTANDTALTGLYGGAVYAADDGSVEHVLNITDSVFTNNFAGDTGGAVTSYGPTTNISGSSFNANFAQFQQASADQNFVTGTGGAVEVRLNFGETPVGGTGPLGTGLTINSSSFQANSSEESGGAVFFLGNETIVPSAAAAGRAAPGPSTTASSAAFVNEDANLSTFSSIGPDSMSTVAREAVALEAGNVVGASATGSVQARNFGDAQLEIIDSSFLSNQTVNLGGGVASFIGGVDVINSRFFDNRSIGAVDSGGAGGGLWASDSDLFVFNSEFSGNSAINTTAPVDPDTFGPDYGFGGALEVQIAEADPNIGFGVDVYNVAIVQSTFSGNTSDARAAMSFSAFGETGATVDPAFVISITQSTVVLNDGLDSAIVIQPTDTFLDDTTSFTVVNSFLAGNTGFVDDDGDPLTPQVQEPANFGTTAALPGGSTFGAGETTSNTILGTDIVFDFDGDELTPATPAAFATDSPALAPLAFNGGSTRNHLPLPGSDAIDNGAPALAVNPGADNVAGDDPDTPADESLDDVALVFDQRGAPFDRVFDDPMVVDDFVDIGAIELSAAPPEVVATSYDASTLEVVFEIDQDVSSSIDPSDLIATNVTTATQIDTSTVTAVFLPGLNLAVFSLVPLVQSGLLTNGNYEFSLDTAGVANSGGATLVSSPFIEDFFLAGDADRSRSVNLADFGILRSNFGGTPVDGFLSADFNLDGAVNLADFGILRANFGQSVAAPADSLFSDDEL